MIRDEFHEQTADIKEHAENVLVTFGGSDPLNLTTDSVEALGQRDLPFSYRLVLGPDFSHEAELSDLSEDVLSSFEIIQDSSDMGALMSWADIALSSGGRTVYELAATGTPTIVIAQNDGEVERMKLLCSEGVIDFLGHGQNVDMETVPDCIINLAKDVNRRRIMSKRGKEMVDGRGVNRILDLVYEVLVG